MCGHMLPRPVCASVPACLAACLRARTRMRWGTWVSLRSHRPLCNKNDASMGYKNTQIYIPPLE